MHRPFLDLLCEYLERHLKHKSLRRKYPGIPRVHEHERVRSESLEEAIKAAIRTIGRPVFYRIPLPEGPLEGILFIDPDGNLKTSEATDASQYADDGSLLLVPPDE
jgi:hypothetical protein